MNLLDYLTIQKIVTLVKMFPCKQITRIRVYIRQLISRVLEFIPHQVVQSTTIFAGGRLAKNFRHDINQRQDWLLAENDVFYNAFVCISKSKIRLFDDLPSYGDNWNIR